MDATFVGDEIDEILIPEEKISNRLSELASEIERRYSSPVLFVGVLKGAVMFMTDLARKINMNIHMDWIAVSSYGSSTTSSGVVRILKDLDTDIVGKQVILIEDIVDSGLTLSWLKSNLESRGAKKIDIVTFLRKPDAMKIELDFELVGFDIPNRFVVGYGLDYDEKYRNLNCIATLKPSIYEG